MEFVLFLSPGAEFYFKRALKRKPHSICAESVNCIRTMFTQQKPNPDGGITVLEFEFQKHPQDLPQSLKAEGPRFE